MPFKGWTDKDGTYRKGFQDRFDEIAARYGWDHSMSAKRRARTIYETNLATARAAGRVAQATDPAVKKAFPYGQYHHAHTRVPSSPRERHRQWDGLILPVNDPFWQTHTPPNGWRCSCGFTTLTAAKLKRLGKDGPDPSPTIAKRPVLDPSTGKLVEYPEPPETKMTKAPDLDARAAELDAREQKLAEAEKTARHQAHIAFADQLVAEARLPTGERDLVVALFDALPVSADQVSFAVGEDIVKDTPAGLLKRVLKARPAAVAFGETDLGQPPASGQAADFAAPDGFSADPEQLALHQKAVAFQKANPGTDYIAAVGAVS